ncbi:hypothetical protein KHA94_18460 [Bacillus sp. FJAT-49705]|uniref:DUF4309 domain-containing protein n=1 Tax=Cytobacillus citreus TaxID=2833586 RepID=A0ABS5NWD4_9BACI|nr:hypothetical protein [Cytobacillus citreus]MBS4192152.1 hypothetical protein [Cytobacillus citreus]
MKNYLYILALIMLSGILAACMSETNASNDEIERKQQNLSTTVNHPAVISEKKEKKDTVWLKEKSLYQFEAYDGSYEYTVFLYAEDEQSSLNENLGVKNQIYTGHYSIYLAEKDSAVAYKQEALDEAWTSSFVFNSSFNQVYPLNLGNKTFITILQPSENENSKLLLFAIKDGEIKQVQFSEDLTTIFGSEMKSIYQKYIQTAHLQGDQEWRFITWEFDEKAMTLKKKDESTLNGENGEKWYERWSKKSEIYYPFQNLKLSSDVIEKAKQGLPIGSPYPIGTNIANIKKNEPIYIEEGIADGTPYVMYPEITYYYEKTTGIVTAVSIPGERVKTSIKMIKSLFGEPDEEGYDPMNGEKRVIYNADKYAINFMPDADGNVRSIYLWKK